MALEVSGQGAELLRHEAGAHRVQRVPATEKSGRVHTSTVTVAVLDEGIVPADDPFARRARADFRLEWYNGTIKAGGQHHQKNATCARLTHLPTGLVRTAQTRSRANSEALARAALAADLDARGAAAGHHESNARRKAQIGNGERGASRRRLWRFQDDLVQDHTTGRSHRASRALRGDLRPLWPSQA